MKKIVLLVIAVSILSVAAMVPSHRSASAQEQRDVIVDRVVAVVEDRSVLKSEIDLEVKRYMLQQQRTFLQEDEEKKIRKEVLDALIANHLLAVHADKKGIEVNDDEVDSAVERMIDENKRTLGGDEAFELQLEREGMTLQKLRTLYRERIRSKILVERLFREVLWEVTVTESEVTEYFREHFDELPMRPPTVSLATILFLPKASGRAMEEPLKLLREIEKRVRSGEDFAELAKEYSEGPSAPYGGSLGYIKFEDFANHPTFVNAVRGLTVGEVSGPVLTGFGYHLIKLEDVSGDRVLVRHILIKVESGEDDVASTATLADSIRALLVAGADFAEMAARYSGEQKAKANGGVVGDVAIGNLPEHIRDVLKDVGDGEIAPVVRDKEGFRIFKVLGRSPERPYTFEEAHDELKILIEHQKKQELFVEYVNGLKELYYVEVKEDL